MIDEEHYRKLERAYTTAPTNQYYQPVLRITEGAAKLVIPVRPEFLHAAQAVHGSVYFKALDDAAFFAANSLIDDVFVLTASFNIYLIRPVSGGELRAEGRVVHRSPRFFLAESELVDSEGHALARGSGTFVRSKIPLDANVGYV